MNITDKIEKLNHDLEVLSHKSSEHNMAFSGLKNHNQGDNLLRSPVRKNSDSEKADDSPLNLNN